MTRTRIKRRIGLFGKTVKAGARPKIWEKYAKITNSSGEFVDDWFFLNPKRTNVPNNANWYDINDFLKNHLRKLKKLKVLQSGFGGDDSSGYVVIEYTGKKEPNVPPMKFLIEGEQYTMTF